MAYSNAAQKAKIGLVPSKQYKRIMYSNTGDYTVPTITGYKFSKILLAIPYSKGGYAIAPRWLNGFWEISYDGYVYGKCQKLNDTTIKIETNATYATDISVILEYVRLEA